MAKAEKITRGASRGQRRDNKRKVARGRRRAERVNVEDAPRATREFTRGWCD